jgi:hypothetical protein
MEKGIKLELDIDTLLDAFDLTCNNDNSCLTLQDWQKTTGLLTPIQNEILNEIYQRLIENGDFWNEEELKINFIAFVFYLASIDEVGKIKTFFERSISAVINEKLLSVKCDCMVATPKGKGTPKAPYFFLQEYKKQKGDKNDPEGQMLAAMLIAQATNQDHKPLYGCYLVGRNWYFTTLIDKNYCISRQYDAKNKVDLLQIVFILQKLKLLILNR